MTKPTIAAQAKAAADSAAEAARLANQAAAAAQRASDEKRGVRFGPKVAAWEWVDYAEQSANRANAYAHAAIGAASVHNFPEAKRRLRNVQSEADGAWSNAERAGVVPRYLRS